MPVSFKHDCVLYTFHHPFCSKEIQMQMYYRFVVGSSLMRVFAFSVRIVDWVTACASRGQQPFVLLTLRRHIDDTAPPAVIAALFHFVLQ